MKALKYDSLILTSTMCVHFIYFQLLYSRARMCHKSYEFLCKNENAFLHVFFLLLSFTFNVFYEMSVFIFISKSNPTNKKKGGYMKRYARVRVCVCVRVFAKVSVVRLGG